MVSALGLLVRPRRTLVAAAERERLGPGVAAVAVTGLASLGLELGAALLEPHQSPTGAVVASAALPLLFVGFWGVGGWLIAAGARSMGAPARQRTYLGVSGITFPALIPYAVIALAQAVAIRWWGDVGSTISDGIGLLALPLLLWFIALTAVAVMSVYDVSPMSSLALALLPYAVLSAAVLVLIIAVSALRLL